MNFVYFLDLRFRFSLSDSIKERIGGLSLIKFLQEGIAMQKFVLSACLLVLVVSLVGCGGDTKPAAPASTPATTAATTPAATK
jgi:hypothetical protein